MTLALSTFYRTALNRGRNVLQVETELSNTRAYLEIQSMLHDGDFDSVMDRILNKGLQDQIQRLALQDFRLCFDFVIKIPVMQQCLLILSPPAW